MACFLADLLSFRASAILDTIERLQSSKIREVSGRCSACRCLRVISLEFGERLKHFQDISVLSRNLQ
eukprot:764491-Hanusia_phi.AAC.1